METRRVCRRCHKHLKIEIKVPIIWIIGGPGCGKGTQCDKIVETYGFLHISSGDLIRREVENDSELTKTLIEIMESGRLVPTDIVLKLIKDELYKHIETAKGFLLDGYPREKDQGILFEEIIGPPTAILLFDAPEEILVDRILNRAKTSCRVDDNEDTLRKRLVTYYNLKEAIIDEYRTKIKIIDADKTPNEIFNEVKTYLDPLFE